MNIFALSDYALESASWLVDRHCVKMTLEYAQLLCSPFEPGIAPYRRTHYNHPCAKWARESVQNYYWLACHAIHTANEYFNRYGRTHKSKDVIYWCIHNYRVLKLPDIDRTPFVQCMPDEFKGPDSVMAYRRYYKFGKAHIHAWKRNRPNWLDSPSLM